MSIANPHQLEPVPEGLFCWRINQQRSWNANLYTSEVAAILGAQDYCKTNLGIGRHTIYLGMTRTTSVDPSGPIQRHLNTISLTREYDDLFRAMCLPKSKWAQTAKAIASAISPELNKAAKLCSSTHILKVRHVFFSVTPILAGIQSCSLDQLVLELRTVYKMASPDWLKVSRLQQLVCDTAKEFIQHNSLPFAITSMRIWQGIDRTKDRLHIVCVSPYESGRFGRLPGEPLCQKSPKQDDKPLKTDLPCLACFDKLVSIEKAQQG